MPSDGFSRNPKKPSRSSEQLPRSSGQGAKTPEQQGNLRGAPPGALSSSSRAPLVTQGITPAQLAVREVDQRRAERLGRVSRAKNTIAAYRNDWKVFSRWMKLHGYQLSEVSPELLVQFLAWMEETPAPATGKPYGLKSIQRACVGVWFCLRQLPEGVLEGAIPRHYPNCVLNYLDALKRRAADRGYRPRKKVGVSADMLLKMLPHLGDGLNGVRNRAILSFFWACGRRRSAVSVIRIEDLALTEDGDLRVYLARSKTDQHGKGEHFIVARLPKEHAAACPVRLTLAWLRAAQLKEGPLFRGVLGGVVQPGAMDPRIVARVVKRGAAAVGLNEADFGGHSLRRGLITSMAAAGHTAEEIGRFTNQSAQVITREYIERVRVPVKGSVAEVFQHDLDRAAKLEQRKKTRAEHAAKIAAKRAADAAAVEEVAEGLDTGALALSLLAEEDAARPKRNRRS